MRARLCALAIATGLAACSPYDPSLPPAPFLCATDEPRCPDGFTCVADAKQMVCRANGTTIDAGAPGTTSP
jgi:hypothetical protein